MITELSEKTKRVIGLYGEMQLAMILHERGWQVHRAYIDEVIDFVITKYFCNNCKKFTEQFIREQEYNSRQVKCLTNLCKLCRSESLSIITKYLQVKTSEGITTNRANIRQFSFHPKIRYNIGRLVYYVWIAVFVQKLDEQNKVNAAKTHYYIFNTNEVKNFDDIEIPTYQITDNQKTNLTINIKGEVLNKGKKYNYACFRDFHNNFKVLDDI